MSNIISSPKSVLIEKTALEFAAIFWETGKSQGMTSKYKTAKEYAKKNMERFVPAVIKSFVEMLNNPSLPKEMKEPIFEALMERHNDPTTKTNLPNIDVDKMIEIAKMNQGNDATKDNLKTIQIIENAIKGVNQDYIRKLKD